MATIGHMMSEITKSKVKTTDPVRLVTYKQFCQVSLDTSLGHISKLLDMDHFVLVVHNQRMGKYLNTRNSGAQIQVAFVMRAPSHR